MNAISIWFINIWSAYFIAIVKSEFCYSDPKLTEINDFLLENHNYYRRMHDASPMILDTQLMNDSTSWCRLISKIGKLQLSHSSGNYGENLWIADGYDNFNKKVVDPVKNWYEQIDYYTFETGEYKSTTGQFTQVVWKSSRLLGCGICSNENIIYVTCRYVPAGNVVGEFVENVRPSRGLGRAKTLPVFDFFFGLLIILFSAAALASLIVYVLKTYWMKKLGEDPDGEEETGEEEY